MVKIKDKGSATKVEPKMKRTSFMMSEQSRQLFEALKEKVQLSANDTLSLIISKAYLDLCILNQAPKKEALHVAHDVIQDEDVDLTDIDPQYDLPGMSEDDKLEDAPNMEVLSDQSEEEVMLKICPYDVDFPVFQKQDVISLYFEPSKKRRL